MKRNLIYHTNISANQTIEISNDEGFSRECHLDSIRRDGATLTCDRATLDSLLPNSQSIAPKQPASLTVAFTLDNTHERIHASCDVIYARRVSRESYLLELKFAEIGDREFERVDHYVEKAFKSSNQTRHLKVVA